MDEHTETPFPHTDKFAKTLARYNIELKREKPTTLQINTGYLCNQTCKHCHLEAGPNRNEIMKRTTMDDVICFAGQFGFDIIDITGGAPEMVPDIDTLLRKLRPLCRKMMIRSNLTALYARKEQLLPLYKELKISVFASLPSTNESQTEAQRGKGVFDGCLAMLQELNRYGYGMAGTGLELNLVANPVGAFLPSSQCQAEKKFRQDLHKKWDVNFNSLFTFANMPLGRFRHWLETSGNLTNYLQKLENSFNPSTIEGLMCRTLISVSWDGYVYDCDFNQAANLPTGGKRRHIKDFTSPPSAGSDIMIGDHCFACTAGTGFT